MVAFGLSFVAGLLTSLSPCVLPALPIVVGSAAADRRHGPLALAAGLVVAFTAIGVALASASATLGISDVHVRRGAAAMLIVAGAVLLSPRLQEVVAQLTSPLASAASRSAAGTGRGLGGQFVVGALLGAVWSPCVGPTLGAAVSLAAGGDSLPQATLMMFLFGVGSAIPLVATAYASRHVLARRGALMRGAATGKLVFGAALLLMGLAVFAGVDKMIEAAILDRLPQWWIDLIAGV